MSIDFSMTLERGKFLLDARGSLPSTETIALIGKSGSGKTTLLRCLAGLEPRAKGTLTFNGETWHSTPGGVFLPCEERRIGYVFQQGALFPHLSVSQNIEYARKRALQSPSSSLEQAIHAIGISNLMGREANTLSGGETQRVAIARTLASNPKMLLLDEPLSALDWDGRAEIIECLEKTLSTIDIPTIIVTHTLADAAKLASFAMQMVAGSIEKFGPSKEILPSSYELAEDRREPFTALDATVTSHDETYHLSQLETPIGKLHVPHCRQPCGSPTKVTIWARDVSLALERPTQTSLLNALPAEIVNLTEFDRSKMLVNLSSSSGTLKSLVTKKSAATLNLKAGSKCHCLIKSVSLI